MKSSIDYTFDDAEVTCFTYDSVQKLLKIQMSNYYDEEKASSIDKPCLITISNWSIAKSQVNANEDEESLESHLGIAKFILYLNVIEDKVDLYIDTLQNEFVMLSFYDAKISFRLEDSLS